MDWKEYLSYDPDTGLFTWIKRTSNRVRVGDVAGSPIGSGYIKIGCKGKAIYAHRLAFIMMGEEVPEIVDHINHEKADNRWCNIRPSNKSHNGFHRKYKTEGVRKLPSLSSKPWAARIMVNRRERHLGYFATKAEALAARQQAEEKYFGSLG